MKLSNLAASALLCATTACSTTPAHAGTILPNLFASEYCSLRSIGATETAAVRKATIRSDDWIYVDYAGKRLRSDHLQATLAAYNRCPQFKW